MILPIVDRELRVAARRPSTYWTRFSAAAISFVLVAWLLRALRREPPAQAAITLFVVLSSIAFVLGFVAAFRHAADCLSEEKREGTLGLLFLTDLRGYDVVLGKLVASSVHAVYAIAATLPLLAIPLLIGGVAPIAFWQMVAVLLNTLFFTLAAAVMISAVSRDARRAAFGTFLVTLFFAGGLPGAGWLYAEFLVRPPTGRVPEAFLVPSPVYSFGLAIQAAIRSRPDVHFWKSIFVVHTLAWSFLLLTVLVLPRAWQDRPAGARQVRWRTAWLRWAFGNPAKRAAFRAQLLARNPVSWIEGRHRSKRVFLWLFLGITAVVWAFGFIKAPHDWLNASVGIWFMLGTHTVFKLWVASEAGRLFLNLRRTGALELLLSTPLTIGEILRGQMLALRLQFGFPLCVVLAADCLLMVGGVRRESGSDLADISAVYLIIMAVFVVDYYALNWAGMWAGLSARRANRAMGSAAARILLLPWIFFIGLVIVYITLRLDRVYEPRSPIPVFLSWFLIALVTDAFFISWSRRRLLSEFRVMAAQQFGRPEPAWWRPWTAKRRPTPSTPALPPPGPPAQTDRPRP
jgi:ABC-type transport system involved in cytochrome c biogenesis permease component